MQQNAALIGRFEVARIELEDMLEAQECISRPIERCENAAQMLPQFRVIRLELHGLVEHVERVGKAPHLLQGNAERRQIFRSGRLPDRP
jgi:hypothetical protein